MLGGVLGSGKPPPINPKTGKPMRVPPTMAEQILKQATTSAARSIGTQVSRAILRNVLGGILGGGSKRRDRDGSGLPIAPEQASGTRRPAARAR